MITTTITLKELPNGTVVMLNDAYERGDTALLRTALDALEYHRDQTRPIARTDEAISAIRARLSPNSQLSDPNQ